MVKNRKGHYKELFEQMRKKGYMNIRIDGQIRELTYGLKVDRYKNHNIELVVDKLKVSAKDDKRLSETADVAFNRATASLWLWIMKPEKLLITARRLWTPYRDCRTGSRHHIISRLIRRWGHAVSAKDWAM